MIDIIDELNIDNVTRFSMAAMTSADQSALAKVGGSTSHCERRLT